MTASESRKQPPRFQPDRTAYDGPASISTPQSPGKPTGPAATDGIINLNKPAGITSAKALYKVRSITRQRKSGHGGTLDPAATGVLLLCLGKATKLVELIMDQPKVYRATARLDVTSESFDSDRPLIPVSCDRVPDIDEIRQALSAMEGVVEQAPPAISAIKIGGRPAYKLARRGQPLDLAPRSVRIYWTQIHSYAWPFVDFEMCCGRGTYVRSVIRDLGVAVGTGGCLTGLIRTRTGPFALEDAWTLDELSNASPDAFVVPLDEARQRLLAGREIIPVC